MPFSLQVELKQKQAAADLTAPYSKSYNRVMISTILDAPDGGASLVNRTLRVGGWVKTGREAGAGQFAFLEVNDGSCFASLQIMITAEVAEAVGGLSKLVPTSTSVLIEGTLSETPPGTKQKVRIEVGDHAWCIGMRPRLQRITAVRVGSSRVAREGGPAMKVSG